MSYLEKSALAQNPEFRGRIQVAALTAANTNLSDSNKPFIVRKYAQHVANNIGGSWLNSFVYQVLANPVINNESSDQDILYSVSTNFEQLAEAHYSNI